MMATTPSVAPGSLPMNKAAPLLDVRGLRVAFNGQPVVHGIDFSVAAGEKLALVGESGSGKTVSALSLLKLVQGAQVSGQALLDGENLLALSEQRLRGVRGDQVAVIFQEPMSALNPLFPVGEQIAEVLQLKKGLTAAQAKAATVELLASTGIQEPARRAAAFPHQLSGGQRQRAMIAMALASAPRLLIADEPTTALDVTVRAQILDLLSDLQRQHGMAVLLITHDLRLVRHFADRVAVMEHGHLVEQGTVAQVYADPQHPYTRRLLASEARRDVVEAGSAQAEPVLRASGLRVSYPVPLPGIKGWFRQGAFVALQGADFALAPGTTLGVVGESGSGKSTLALAALGLLPHEGHLQVAGTDWAQAKAAGRTRALRQAVQVVFQDPVFLAVPAFDGGADRGRRAHRARAPTQRPTAARARAGGAGRCRAGAGPGPGRLAAALSARVLRRAASAAGDRSGAHRPADAAGAGRTDQRAGRHGAAAGAGAAAAAAA